MNVNAEPMDLLQRNWLSKLGALALAVVVWWLIKSELHPPQRGIEDIALPPQDVRDL